jgi:hypothetical protein
MRILAQTVRDSLKGSEYLMDCPQRGYPSLRWFEQIRSNTSLRRQLRRTQHYFLLEGPRTLRMCSPSSECLMFNLRTKAFKRLRRSNTVRCSGLLPTVFRMISSSDIGKVKLIDSIRGVKFVGKFPAGCRTFFFSFLGSGAAPCIQRKEITVACNRGDRL